MGPTPADATHRGRRRSRGPPVSRFERLGRFVVRRRWWIVAAWGLLLVVAMPFALQARGALRPADSSATTSSPRQGEGAARRPRSASPPAAVVVVFHRRHAHARASRHSRRRSPRPSPASPTSRPCRAASCPICSRPARSGSTATRPTTSSSSTCRPTTRRRRCRPWRAPPPGAGPRGRGWPAARRSTATSRRCPRRTSGAASSISLPLAALALLLVFGAVVAAAVPLVGRRRGGASSPWPRSSRGAALTPMSIFVLNLATLLGLGPGRRLLAAHDQPVPRGAGARREADGADAVATAVGATVATAGRAVFFSRADRAARAARPVLFEFMILRSVGIAGAIVVGVAVAAAMTLLPGDPGASLGTRLDALAVRGSTGRAGAEGLGAPRPVVMRRPVAVFVPTLAVLLLLGSPFLHVRFNAPGRVDPAADRAVARGLRPARATSSARASSRRSSLAIRTTGAGDGPANLAALFDYSRRLAARPARRPRRQPRRRRSAAHPRAVPAPVRRPGGPPRPVRRRRPRGDDAGRPHRVHGLHAVRPEPRRGPGAGRSDLRDPAGRSRRRPG